MLDTDDDEGLDDAVDKAATPAVRISNEDDLEREMDRARPQLLVGQRDSGGQREVDLSRTQALASVAGELSGENKGAEVPTSAFSSLTALQIQTGSTLLGQFHTSYIPRVFNLSLPWCVGGPDFHGCKRWRRASDAPPLPLDKFTQMMSERVEANIRWDWDLNPSLWSLSFASKVNLGVSMSIKRCLRPACETDNANEQRIGEATAHTFASCRMEGWSIANWWRLFRLWFRVDLGRIGWFCGERGRSIRTIDRLEPHGVRSGKFEVPESCRGGSER